MPADWASALTADQQHDPAEHDVLAVRGGPASEPEHGLEDTKPARRCRARPPPEDGPGAQIGHILFTSSLLKFAAHDAIPPAHSSTAARRCPAAQPLVPFFDLRLREQDIEAVAHVPALGLADDGSPHARVRGGVRRQARVPPCRGAVELHGGPASRLPRRRRGTGRRGDRALLHVRGDGRGRAVLRRDAGVRGHPRSR